RRIACFSAAFGLGVLGLFAFASRNLLFEEWQIYKLKRGNAQERGAAAKKLGDLGSVKALPFLMEGDPRDGRARAAMIQIALKSQGAAFPVLLQLFQGKAGPWRGHAIKLFGLMKSDAKPAIGGLFQALEEENEGIRLAAAWAIGEIEPEWKGIPHFIAA